MSVGHITSGQHPTDSSVSEFGASDYSNLKVTIFLELCVSLKVTEVSSLSPSNGVCPALSSSLLENAGSLLATTEG